MGFRKGLNEYFLRISPHFNQELHQYKIKYNLTGKTKEIWKKGFVFATKEEIYTQ